MGRAADGARAAGQGEDVARRQHPGSPPHEAVLRVRSGAPRPRRGCGAEVAAADDERRALAGAARGAGPDAGDEAGAVDAAHLPDAGHVPLTAGAPTRRRGAAGRLRWPPAAGLLQWFLHAGQFLHPVGHLPFSQCARRPAPCSSPTKEREPREMSRPPLPSCPRLMRRASRRSHSPNEGRRYCHKFHRGYHPSPCPGAALPSLERCKVPGGCLPR